MKKLYFNTNKELSNVLKGHLKEVASKDGEWAAELEDSELGRLGVAIKKLGIDDEINARFDAEDELDYDFSYDRTKKMIFVTYLSNVWETDRTIKHAVRALHDVEKYERKFNKSLIHFSKEESLETIQGFDMRNKLFGLKFRIKIYKDYYNFYSRALGLLTKDNFWKKLQSSSVLSEFLGEAVEKDKIITKEDLLGLFYSMTNPQQAIVPLLIFEGVGLSRKYESDEIRSMKKRMSKVNLLSYRRSVKIRTRRDLDFMKKES